MRIVIWWNSNTTKHTHHYQLQGALGNDMTTRANGNHDRSATTNISTEKTLNPIPFILSLN